MEREEEGAFLVEMRSPSEDHLVISPQLCSSDLALRE